ncbi:MAG: 3-dehydroquinate synthase [bacterium ADurb.Bin374]|nr:MAG: 3-dehydroquinate synthase [bacterium ADurb.Bin374]
METQKLSFARQMSHDILLGHDILSEIVGRMSRLGLHKRCIVVTNETVARWYLQPLIAELRTRGFETHEAILPDGETHKTLETAQSLFPKFLEAGLDRKSPVIALGGGVVCDLAGFAASVYMRGLPLVLMPTSLLAMIDASLGGKNGVNLPEGKNLIGTFHQPALLGIDVSALRTLPLNQLSYGIVEAVKHGAIADAPYFKFIQKNCASIKARDLPLMQRLVRRSLHIKKTFVEADELDTTGSRASLNFGHTFGHAYEALGGYLRHHHGEAVGLGMLTALSVSRARGLLKEDYTESLTSLLKEFGLPVELPREYTPDAIANAILHDKKRQRDAIKLILPVSLGAVEKVLVPISDLKPLLESVMR